MIPKFRPGEVVRYVSDDGWLPIGTEAVVWERDDGRSWPRETGWTVAAWVDDGDGEDGGPTLWEFPVQDLESTGLIQDEKGVRRPVSGPLTEEWVDDIGMRLHTPIERRFALRRLRRVRLAVEQGLNELLHPAVLEVTTDWHHDTPSHYHLHVHLVPAGDSIEAFRTLLTLCEPQELDDDGWALSFRWWRSGEDATVFLHEDVEQAEVTMTPWSSPAIRAEDALLF